MLEAQVSHGVVTSQRCCFSSNVSRRALSACDMRILSASSLANHSPTDGEEAAKGEVFTSSVATKLRVRATTGAWRA